MFEAKGIIPAVASPVDKDGRIHEGEFRRLLDSMLGAGVHGLFVNGGQGEFYALRPEEKARVLEVTIDHTRGRVPVYAGVGAVTTREAVQLARDAERLGADAVSAITPYYIHITEDELYDHYRAVAGAVSTPVLLYGNPERTGQALPVSLVSRLAEIDNIVGIKDSSGDLTLTGEYIRLLGPRGFQVVAGRDTLILATLVYGGTGSIAATANVAPRVVVDIYEHYAHGDLARALEAQQKLAPLRLAFGLGSFPVVVKEALRMIGFDLGTAMEPVKGLSAEKKAALRRILVDMNLVPGPTEG